MPIPLVKADGQWHFDTAAGKEEIINRHIGKDELHAIGVCRAYVAAQRQYAGANPDAAKLRAEIQEHARHEGWPLLGSGGERTGQPIRAFGGASSCRGFWLEDGHGCCSRFTVIISEF